MKKRKHNANINTNIVSNHQHILVQHTKPFENNSTNTRGPTLTKGITPYDTGKVKIGIYYEPKPNYYNPDQDWVQKALLGIETSWTTDFVLFCLLYSVLLYAVMGLITRSFYE